jgi:DNA-binding beta-propeller fold protein YncE
MTHPIDHSVSARAQAGFANAGHCKPEDVKFSASGRRIAVAGFYSHQVVLFEVELDISGGATRVALTDAVTLSSPSFRKPHGIAFIDEDTLVVANRAGGVPIVHLPEPGSVGDEAEASVLQTIAGDVQCQIKTPGSVHVMEGDGTSCEVLICTLEHSADQVTRHWLDKRDNFIARNHTVLLSRGLKVPDGVTSSQDGRWIAVSNQDERAVYLYENTPQLHPDSEPQCILRGVHVPHGLRFTGDGAYLLVADGGARYVNVYARGQGDWRGTRFPKSLFPVMSRDLFRLGRNHPKEGGPKGLDIDKGMTVLVTSCSQQPLAFFDLSAVLASNHRPLPWILRTLQRSVFRVKFGLQWRMRRLLDRVAGAQPQT